MIVARLTSKHATAELDSSGIWAVQAKDAKEWSWRFESETLDEQFRTRVPGPPGLVEWAKEVGKRFKMEVEVLYDPESEPPLRDGASY